MDRPRLRWLAVRASYRARATVTFALAAAIVSVALGLLSYTVSRSYLTDQRESAGRDRAYLNARFVRDQLRARAGDPGAAIAALSAEEGSTVLVRYGEEWFSSSVAIGASDLPIDVLREIEGGVAAWQRYRIRGEPHLAVAVPLPAVGAVYAEVIPMVQLEDALDTMSSSLLAAGAATTVAGGLIGFLLAGRLVRPLRKLAERAEAIAAGEAVGLEPVTDPDLQPLVGSLNRVIESYAERVEQGSRFASDVSHEVRAPLAALSAAIDVMQRRRKALPDRSAHALDLLSEQVDGFQHLVLDLLEISRIDAGRAEVVLEPTDCGALVKGATATVSRPDLPVTVDPDVPSPVLLDRRRMGQVLVNFLDNAQRYAGGPTSVSVSRAGDMLRFRVCDQGPGVPLEERARIFGRFERGEHGVRGPRGTGLGLALAAEHAALHGGRVYVEDADGGGAAFVAEVKLCEPD
ncbi:MAG TPA: HAMP domain-containing sensor histidine kinase [Acidimicrobiales bacterium]|nr:HAMP domain-containing sensor histidine kinase [Acidimicrobiales bacterium]